MEDNDNSTSAGTASFVDQGVRVDEPIGSVSIAVARTGGSSEALTVGYIFVDSTTTKGVDYMGIDGNLTWLAGDTTNKVIQVLIIDDGRADSGEIFYVSLTATEATLLVSQTTFTVVLEDNDIDTPGTVTFATASQTVLESLGQASVLVQRIGGSVGEVSVSYETAAGTALENLDFLVSSGTLIWADGDSADKEVLVPLVNDNFFEGNETLSISLSDVAGGNVAGANSVHSITIKDDEPEPATWFEFKRSLYSGTESAGQVQIEVERFGSGVGAASVSIQSANNTAFVGLDFVHLNEQLNWLDGETGVRVVTLILVDDQIDESTEEVTLVLADPSENTLIGDLSDASALIYDDDGTIGELVNLSTRGFVGIDQETMIAGFVVTGTPGESSRVVIRALGNSLVQGGLSPAAVVPDPDVYLVNSEGSIIDSNQQWVNGPAPTLIAEFGLAPIDPNEAVIVTDLFPGSYTAHVRDSQGRSGIGLVEAYYVEDENSGGATSRLINISTRSLAGSGDESVIGGLVVSGSKPKQVLIRGIGESLGAAGVANALSDTFLELFSGGTKVTDNDDWQSAANSGEVQALLAPGAASESAILVTLEPGAYTAILSGAGGQTGIALIEIYEVN
ncbi:hypothetical protein N9C83_03960 [Opitutales bacterium]|nr:hypothetical protein [Opitutales bacterium]